MKNSSPPSPNFKQFEFPVAKRPSNLNDSMKRNLLKIPPNGHGETTSLGSRMLSAAKIMREMELLDWTGHVELPINDMLWLASSLFVKLNKTTDEVCDACCKAAPIVLSTTLGNICAECVEDMNDQIDQQRDMLSDE